ncbi:MAG TPA: hypothetical protein PLD18_11985 [Flavobacterium sp.]|nr:hypothetical protein [Flavobacterium sp.]HRA72234.1 hypothetical protein [Flavobacterium sp.]
MANANGVLQPKILMAILLLYQNGNSQMSAINVRQECFNLNNTRPWNSRLPSICNAMRNAIKCSGEIIGENRDFLEFTISFRSL